jgi:hypothetical protein
MLEFRMSKRQVLTEFYIREIPLLSHVMAERVKARQLDKVNNYSMMLRIATLTCGWKPDVDGINKLSSSFQKQFRELMPAGFEDSGAAEAGAGENRDPYEQLRALQQRMAQNRVGKTVQRLQRQ